MTLWESYLQYTSGVLDGSKPCPAGITIEGTDDMARAASLLTQAEKLGMDGFVKACAAAEGVEIPQDVFDDYKPQEIEALLEQLSAYNQRPSRPTIGSSPAKEHGSWSQVSVGLSDHMMNSGSTSAEWKRDLEVE